MSGLSVLLEMPLRQIHGLWFRPSPFVMQVLFWCHYLLLGPFRQQLVTVPWTWTCFEIS